ncbi:MAG: transcription antitermination factor NusB, partial [Butyricicoccaceae bacterium]
EGAAINEAVELAKKYDTEQAASFINGVLGGVARGTSAPSEETAE